LQRFCLSTRYVVLNRDRFELRDSSLSDHSACPLQPASTLDATIGVQSIASAACDAIVDLDVLVSLSPQPLGVSQVPYLTQ
jgi:hypothetical protein